MTTKAEGSGATAPRTPYYAHIKRKAARQGMRMDAVLTHILHALHLVEDRNARRALETALDFLRDAIKENN